MSLSPKQIAVKALLPHVAAMIAAAKQDAPGLADGKTKRVINGEKAKEMVDTICAPFVAKIEKLAKQKIGKSVADSIDEADKQDAKVSAKKPRKTVDDDGAGF